MTVERPIMQVHGNTATPIGAPETPGIKDQAQNPDDDTKGPIPYERFEQVVRQNQEIREQLKSQQEELKKLSKPVEEKQEFDAKKQDEAEYWKNPYAYERNRERQRADELRLQEVKLQETIEFENAKTQLRTSPEFTPDLEKKMADYITGHGLNELPNRARAVRAAFEAVTGRKFGEWKQNRYETTQQLKERLVRSSGSGQVKPSTMTEEEFNAVPPEEYEKNPQKYNQMLEAFIQAQQ